MDPTAQVIARDGFLYGMCVPWIDYHSFGRDIGRSAHLSPDKTGFTPERFRKTLYNCKAIGFNCVRVWLLDFFEGIVYDGEGRAAGLDDDFIRNVRTVTEMAHEYGLDLMMTFHAHSRHLMRNRFEEYKKYSKILFYPEHMKSYCDNCVAPLARYFSGQKHIIMLDLIAEPEGDIEGQDGNYMEYGGTWESMRALMKMMGDTCKKYAPHIPVTAASGWKWYQSLRDGRYNGIGLDYIGVDIYNNTGEMEAAGTLNCEKPVWLAEFGPYEEGAREWDDSLQTSVAVSFYENTVKQGYVGAFFWMYGAPDAWDQLTIEDRDGRLRPAADAMRYLFIDNIRRHSGRAYEEPALTYTDDPGDLEWFACRGAASYHVERTEDLAVWTQLEIIVPAAAGQTRYRASDFTAEPGRCYRYRIAAIMDNNDVVFSATSPPCRSK